MRLAPIAALLLLGLAPPALAQDLGPTDGTGVERVTMAPGDTAAFTLAQGYSHQLLRPTDPAHPAPHAISVTYRVEGGESVITVTSRTGYPTRCSILADPDGDGGFSAMGAIDVPGDGTPAARRWKGPLGTINLGNFEGGPQGGLARPGAMPQR